MAILHAIETNALDRFVSAALRHLDRVAEGGHTQHPPAAGHAGPVLQRRSRMKHAQVFFRGREAGHGVTLPRRVGITRRGDHHPEGRASVPIRLEPVQLSFDRAFDQVEQVALQTQENRLRLGVAEPAVEFQHARIAGVDHQAGVKETAVGMTFLGHSIEHGLDDFAHDARVQLRGHDRGRRVRAHAAGIRSLIPVPQSLVILAGSERQDMLAVGEDDEARFLAFEEFLDHHAAAGSSHGSLDKDLVDGTMGFALVGSDDHALSGRESVGLDDDGRAAGFHIVVRGPRFVEARERRGRNPVARHEFLGELLGAFQLRTGPRRAENPQALGAEEVDDALSERRLGPDHGEVDAFGEREFGELAGLGDRHVLEAVLARRATVPWSDEDLLHARALREAPRDRVLSAARADDEQLHQCRKCRTPVNTMASPSSSAAAITSSSRTLPPGWITAFAPARATTSTPSRNGKNASDATTDPSRDSPASCALSTATRAASTRLIWPAPMPSVRPPAQNTMAFDLTNFATRHANSKSAPCVAVGFRRVTVRSSEASTLRRSGDCTRSPPPTRLKSYVCTACARLTDITRTLVLAARICRAPASNSGAITTSTKCLDTAPAVAASSSWLKATMPPNAAVGSVAKARSYASRGEAPIAAPQGLACLTITQAG